jgi:hypothetical protein
MLIAKTEFPGNHGEDLGSLYLAVPQVFDHEKSLKLQVRQQFLHHFAS